MRKSVFVFAEYFRGLHQGGLTGGTIAMYEAVSALSKAFDVRVFSFDPAQAQGDLGSLEAIATYLPPPEAGGLRLAAAWNGMLHQAYRDAAKEFGPPDVVIALSDTVPVLSICQACGAKSVVVVQAYENFGGFPPQGGLNDRLSGFKSSIKTGLRSGRIIRDADLVVANSNYMCRAIRSRFKSPRVSVIHPPLSRIFDRSRAARVDAAPRAVGFVTRNAGKNLPFVLSLASKMPDVPFKVFGSLANTPAHPPNVTLMGWFADRFEMFSQASVWIVPSRWPEPFGMVSIEAQAAGQAVLVSNRGGLPETVSTPEQIVTEFDLDLWASRIRDAFSKPQTPAAGFLDRFRADRIGAEWISAVTKVLGV